jgi:hypothetical protein
MNSFNLIFLMIIVSSNPIFFKKPKYGEKCGKELFLTIECEDPEHFCYKQKCRFQFGKQPKGAVCLLDKECSEGLICTIDPEDKYGLCSPPPPPPKKELGYECEETDDCVNGLVCRNVGDIPKSCLKPLKKLGYQCKTGECEAGLQCLYLELFKMTCQKAPANKDL